jgi:molybdenum-dependent DNA-binding transcriptional regulator ModE
MDADAEFDSPFRRDARAACNRLDMFVDKSTAASCAASLWRMAFSFRQIQYFVAAAENGALSRAAHELSLSQSTVAEAIRELEGDLGFPLFERKAQGVELTFKGNQFLRHARKILADVAEARGRCAAIRQAWLGASRSALHRWSRVM